MKNIKNFEEFLNEGSFDGSINEAFEVHFSDGISQMKKFDKEEKAISFAKDLIKNKKGRLELAVFKTGPNFHSTSDTEAVIAWWGDGSYMDNKSKNNPKLAAKKMDEFKDLSEA